MASTATTRNRLEKQGAGENSSTWGAPKLNTLFDLVDTALDGWTTKALTGNVTLTSTNFAADESRSRLLRFTGTGSFQVTIPSVEKWYVVDNQTTGTLTITTGGGSVGTIPTLARVVLLCDATNVYSLNTSPIFNGSVALLGGATIPSSGGGLIWNARGYLTGDGTSESRVYFDSPNQSRFQYNWNTGVLNWAVNGVVVFSVDLAGNAIFKGTVTQLGAPL